MYAAGVVGGRPTGGGEIYGPSGYGARDMVPDPLGVRSIEMGGLVASFGGQ